MTAPTGRIDAAFGWSGHRLREGRGASCRGGWRPPRTRRRPRRVARRSSPSPTRLHVPALAQPVRRPEGGRRQGPVRPGSATRYGPCRRQQRRNAPQAGLRAGAYVASKGCGPAHRRLNALLSAGSLSASVNTAQTASRSSSLRTFPEPVLPSTTAPLIDTAMLAKPFCLSLRASSSTCSGARRTKERSRHRTVSKLSAPAFIRVLV
jgi:hypothetical protein